MGKKDKICDALDCERVCTVGMVQIHDAPQQERVLECGTLWYTMEAYILRINCEVQYAGEWKIIDALVKTIHGSLKYWEQNEVQKWLSCK